jgi:phage terminase large subunit-like protein
MAGNQLGKTISGGFELAMHLTGRYPEWWGGRRFDRPIRAWAAGVTGLSTRDTVQRILLGDPAITGSLGTGSVPFDCVGSPASSRGIAGAVDSVSVKHVSGGESTVAFKSYEQGREKWQGETLDVVWFDEEPDEGIYSEGLTRTNATGGLVFMTFTPLLGMSAVVRRFLNEKSPDRHVTVMTIDDAEHYTAAERARIVSSYPAHEREARANGIPTLGSGRIFPVAEADISVEAFEVPHFWGQIAGIDFGWDHPTAAVRLAWDRDNDILYVTAAHRLKEAVPAIHASAIKAWGSWLPVAWPHDGLQHDKGSGVQIADQYRREGVDMLPEKATFEDGSNGVEAGVSEMLSRMQTGRLKVFSHLNDWWEEFRLYHRRDGKIFKEHDDLISATRYALMMLRYCRANDSAWSKPIKYSNAGIV